MSYSNKIKSEFKCLCRGGYMHVYDHYLSLVMRKPAFCICETKTQISFAVTAKLISAFVFATRTVQSLYFLNAKFQTSSHLQWLYSPVCVGPGRKPRGPIFSERGSFSSILSPNPLSNHSQILCGDSVEKWL